MLLLEKEREQYEHCQQSATNTRSFKSLMSGQSMPTRWIIHNLLPEGLYFLAGTQKIGMSRFNLGMGLSVSGLGSAAGSSLKVQHGNVLYLALEDDERQFQEHLEQLLASGVSVPDDFDYASTWPRLNASGLSDLEEWLHAHPQARLIIIDSWKKVKPLVRAKDGDTARNAEYESLAGLKYLVDSYNVGILVLTRSARIHADKTDREPYSVTGAASCVDGFLTMKQGREESKPLLSGTWQADSTEMNFAVELTQDCWLASTEIESERLKRQKPVLALVQ